jgi:hypothetical protein
MSRKVKTLDNGDVIAYGYDRPTASYFFQKYAAEPDDDGEDVLLIDEDSHMTKMSNAKMLELLIEYKVDDRDIAHVAMDLPIPQSYD